MLTASLTPHLPLARTPNLPILDLLRMGMPDHFRPMFVKNDLNPVGLSLSLSLTSVGLLAVIFSLSHGVPVRHLQRRNGGCGGVVKTKEATAVAVPVGAASARIELEAMRWRASA